LRYGESHLPQYAWPLLTVLGSNGQVIWTNAVLNW